MFWLFNVYFLSVSANVVNKRLAQLGEGVVQILKVNIFSISTFFISKMARLFKPVLQLVKTQKPK